MLLGSLRNIVQRLKLVSKSKLVNQVLGVAITQPSPYSIHLMDFRPQQGTVEKSKIYRTSGRPIVGLNL